MRLHYFFPTSLLLCLGLVVSLTGCSKIYYDALESVGYQKRELLKDRIVSTQESQEKTAEDFKTALERFQELAPFDGGELEEKYNRLSSTVEGLQSRKGEVRKRIDSVDSVAEALFREWDDELSQYANQDLRNKSESKLRATEKNYQDLKDSLERAYSKIDPALTPLKDQVLFLKHNLNARAVSSLDAEEAKISREIASLVHEIELAVAESERFIDELS